MGGDLTSQGVRDGFFRIEYNLQRKRKRPSYFLLTFKMTTFNALFSRTVLFSSYSETNTIVKLGNTEIGTSVIIYAEIAVSLLLNALS